MEVLDSDGSFRPGAVGATVCSPASATRNASKHDQIVANFADTVSDLAGRRQMDVNRLSQWLEFVGGIAILFGLVLVALELRQTADITRAELAMGTGNKIGALHAQLTTTQFSSTYAKMMETPEDLTTAEMLELNGFFTQITGVFLREVSLKRRGIFVEDERIIRGVVPEFFSNSYAQSWWLSNKHRWPPRVVLLVEKELSKLTTDGNLQKLIEIRSNL